MKNNANNESAPVNYCVRYTSPINLFIGTFNNPAVTFDYIRSLSTIEKIKYFLIIALFYSTLTLSVRSGLAGESIISGVINGGPSRLLSFIVTLFILSIPVIVAKKHYKSKSTSISEAVLISSFYFFSTIIFSAVSTIGIYLAVFAFGGSLNDFSITSGSAIMGIFSYASLSLASNYFDRIKSHYVFAVMVLSSFSFMLILQSLFRSLPQ